MADSRGRSSRTGHSSMAGETGWGGERLERYVGAKKGAYRLEEVY